MPRLINLTKRSLVLHNTHGDAVDVPPDPRHIGMVAIGEHQTARDLEGHSFSVNVLHVKEIKGMPDPEDGTLYIVPVEVAMALQGARADVVFPAEDTHVRNASGHLQRITHLRRIASRLA